MEILNLKMLVLLNKKEKEILHNISFKVKRIRRLPLLAKVEVENQQYLVY